MSTPREWLHQGTQLVNAHPWASVEFEQGLGLLQRAAKAEVVDAWLTLGHLYARTPLLPDAASECARWYRKAAEQGHPVAQDRLADLYMLGYGVAADDTEACRWYTRTAEQAYPHALCNLAYMQDAGLGTTRDPHAASQNYLRATALGDARGLFNLGLRYSGTAADSQPSAYACLALAVYAQYPLAAEELAKLDARLGQSTRERGKFLTEKLRTGLRAFRQRFDADAGLAQDPPRLRQFALDNLAALNEPAFTLAGATRATGSPHRPDAPRELHTAPRIFTVGNFTSPGECAHLLALASERLAPASSSTSDLLSGEQTAFTGSAATFRIPDGDAVLRNIERRIGTTFGLPATHVEPLSVLRYGQNDRYAPHVDYFVPARLADNLRIGDHAGQRIASFLVYLRAPEQGGETHYLKLGLKIPGRPRIALCHFNLTPDGKPDKMTLHTGEPILKGEKWLARTTLRENAFF